LRDGLLSLDAPLPVTVEDWRGVQLSLPPGQHRLRLSDLDESVEPAMIPG
jgi:hypothetical protein